MEGLGKGSAKVLSTQIPGNGRIWEVLGGYQPLLGFHSEGSHSKLCAAGRGPGTLEFSTQMVCARVRVCLRDIWGEIAIVEDDE